MIEARPDMTWRGHEDDVLREMYANRTLVDISARLGHRSPGSVRRRANALGLRRDQDYSNNLRRKARAEAPAACQPGWLPASAEPISSSADDHPWNRASRENNEQFLELLQQEFLTSG